MESVDKAGRGNLLGYIALGIAVIFIIGFVFFSHHQNNVIVKNNINEALKQDKTTLASYTFDHKRVDYPKSKVTLDSNHNSLYMAFYNMLHFNTEFGNDKIYEVVGSNGENYIMDVDRKLQVVEWQKK
ncbi:hypothetical protein H5P36_03770 [Bacillus sp. APMAM]|nr:hypothetical protein [Bacillus sp. APMAM]RTZ54395.1 hypothetical protein EKO25_18210 [Bacillus sp. SAJ1]